MADVATFQALARDLRRYSAAREWERLQATDALLRRAWQRASAPDARSEALAQAMADVLVAHAQAQAIARRAAADARRRLGELGPWRDGALGYLRMNDDR
ncbi:hypothetical protein HUS70_19465 [Pandoraea nosoerga]|uniref:Uncharacterized protein n=1 Tax=Pandoraea nosoerga TaxID=2508296 RepID=A0A5E4WFQ1_9BURK|nr:MULTISPECIES: hypothetical protein [Pandoraea]MBN4667381.1 hypothetical protein [Pandoraea nosoerga]MBN4677303.1 hypothetical protein [Pandoraea nosoerga]MBN4682424.1 hypothetical protein [Pandoraea nosoerga]MBN4746779.1 hypothetical protein [Pandoraea nosoerga]VVE22559.1 hypothetical protein PNO31109_03209 [Pandoraea nosoerga]